MDEKVEANRRKISALEFMMQGVPKVKEFEDLRVEMDKASERIKLIEVKLNEAQKTN